MTENLRASDAARRLQIPTKELLRLIHQRAVRFVRGDSAAHVPVDVVEERRAKTS